MSISGGLLPEFDMEAAKTRTTLERVPEDKFGWKPHEKSGTLGWLAVHLATIPHWAVETLQQDSIDVAPPDGSHMPMPAANTRAELLDLFDKSVREGRAAIAAATDEQWSQPWSLLAGGKTLFTMPRSAIFRTWVISHAIHHRAQLGVYLRLNNIPVPAIYGPSADEEGM